MKSIAAMKSNNIQQGQQKLKCSKGSQYRQILFSRCQNLKEVNGVYDIFYDLQEGIITMSYFINI